MLRSELVSALMARRDNDVEVRVGRALVPTDRVDYDPTAERIIIGLDPVTLADVLEGVAEEGVRQLALWRMHVLAPHAALIAKGSKTVDVRAAPTPGGVA